jgi:hypothetical protein
MDRSTYEASCAICGARAELECHCENDRLSVAIDQAEQKWLTNWTNKTRYGRPDIRNPD